MKSLRNLVVLIYFLFIFFDGNSQERKLPKNSIFFELLGNGGLLSINYERSFTPNLYGRTGFGSWSSNLFGSETAAITIPVLVSFITGHKIIHFEIGGGFLTGRFRDFTGSATIFDLTSFLGFRIQAPTRGLLFRIGFTPFLSLDGKADYPEKGLSLSGGISLGYHF